MHLSAVLKAAPRFLMCRPTHFDVQYSINPWMSLSNKVDKNRAMSQWEDLREAIQSAGGQVEVMEPEGGENLPDLVFTANAAVVRGKKAFLASFSNKERQGETALNRRWFESKGYEIAEDEFNPFEGAGDALFAGRNGRILFCGCGPRSSTTALSKVVRHLSTPEDQIKAIACRLVSQRFYHIDTAFCPLNEDTALWCENPSAFDDVARHNIENELRLIAVPECEANNFACNAVVVKQTVILHKGNPQTAKLLRGAGFSIKKLDMSEFLKAGGSAKCCTLLLE